MGRHDIERLSPGIRVSRSKSAAIQSVVVGNPVGNRDDDVPNGIVAGSAISRSRSVCSSHPPESRTRRS